MSGAELIVVVHALLGVLFIAALTGRWIVLGLAAQAADVVSMRTLATAAGPFERMVRIVVQAFVLLFGVVAAFLQGRSVLGPLTGGSVDWLFVSLIAVPLAAAARTARVPATRPGLRCGSGGGRDERAGDPGSADRLARSGCAGCPRV